MKEKIKNENLKPQTVEEAVNLIVNKYDKKGAIEYLNNHQDEVSEFCLQVVESYKDKTGTMLLAQIIEKLLQS